MIMYLAGPITGVKGYRAMFFEADAYLTGLGHTVLDPALLPEGLGDCNQYMKLCLPMIDMSDAVVLLPGWEDSRGACREWGYAKAKGKILIEYDVMVRTEKERPHPSPAGAPSPRGEGLEDWLGGRVYVDGT
ncbi:MAG: DUF4406 domain-containing protein [Ruminococcaceae bacterium]|nr:DUF4406 domain-containing protein [Oscillospiraceae bacterium]